MTQLDRATLEWLIDNLTGSEYNRCDFQTLTMKKDGEYTDYKYFLPEDIREWLIGLLHQGSRHFLPRAVERDYSKGNEELTGEEIVCSCGWQAGYEFVHPHKTFEEDSRDLKAKFNAHVDEEVKKVEERFKWD